MSLRAQSLDLELEDAEDMKLLMQELEKDSSGNSIEEDLSADIQQAVDGSKEDSSPQDDLDSLMEDIGKIEFELPEESEVIVKDAQLEEKKEEINNPSQKIKIIKQNDISSKEAEAVFEVGKIEKDLLEMAKNMQGKIPNDEWNEIAGRSTVGTYEVVKGDWLWKISKNIFGSGFYYSKIWALNPYITNPHEIEPGMILSFTTGSDQSLPSLNLRKSRAKLLANNSDEYARWGENAKPPWIDERQRLMSEGYYLQYSTGDTKDDLDFIGSQSLIDEYEDYEPPRIDFLVDIPETEYDSSGFSKDSKINFNYNEGFHLNTFISNNVVQDFGKVDSAIDEKIFFTTTDTVFVKFDENINVVPGDKFSIYGSRGVKSHKNSDRKGFHYVILGNIEIMQRHNDVWQAKVLEVSSPFRRGDRVTVYTPKIERITESFNPRLIESVLISSFDELRSEASFGDVVFLDRGRADGVEVGNVFEVFGFKDRNTKENITENPSYKNGEVTIITVTDNFSTGLVTSSVRDFQIGDLAVTKTKEAAAKALALKNKVTNQDAARMSEKALDELDVELKLGDLNDSLLDKADKIQFTEDELAELERQEREKSIIGENERDLRSLERLESELSTAEKMLKEARLDEDKLLENESLDNIEKKFGIEQQESLDELEENFGKRYLDEDLNDKENPYGLTEFDIEEIDELLNSEEASEQQ